MITALLIVLAILILTGMVGLVVGMANGCPFAWLQVAFGGMGTMCELLGAVITAIVEQN